MSAIESMMGLLMQPPGPNPGAGLLGPPQVTPSAPPAMPMPTAQPMPRVVAPPQPKGLFSRIMSNLSNIGAPNAPGGYEGLLSPDEIQGAKPGFMARLASITPGAATPGEQYRGGLDRLVQMKMLAEKMAEAQIAKRQQASLLANREKIGAQFAPKEGETPQQSVHRLLGLYDAFVRSGDTEMATKTGEVLKSMSNVLDGPKPVVAKPPEWVDFGGEKRLVAPDGTVLKTEKKTPVPYDRAPASEPLVQVIDEATGEPIWVPRSEAAGRRTRTATTGLGSAAAQKVLAANKTQISVIDDALKELSAHEDAVGIKRGLGELPFMGNVGDTYNQRKDPKGIAARAQIANIGSLIVHDRSGAAVTVSEYPRLAPFVPKVTDTPGAIRIKLGKLRAAIDVETKLYEEGVGKGTVKPSVAKSSTVPSFEDWKKSKGGQ